MESVGSWRDFIVSVSWDVGGTVKDAPKFGEEALNEEEDGVVETVKEDRGSAFRRRLER